MEKPGKHGQNKTRHTHITPAIHQGYYKALQILYMTITPFYIPDKLSFQSNDKAFIRAECKLT